MPQPGMHEGLEVSRQVRQCFRSGALSGLPESDQQRYSNEDAAGLSGKPWAPITRRLPYTFNMA